MAEALPVASCLSKARFRAHSAVCNCRSAFFPPCHGVSRQAPFFEVLFHHFYWDFWNWGDTLKPVWTLALSPVLWHNSRLSGTVSR